MACATTGIITGTAVEDAGVILLARVVGNDGTPITQASLTAITYSVYDITNSVSLGTGTFTISSVVYDTLQTGELWDVDSTGYNFKAAIPASVMTPGGSRCQIDVKFDPVTGENFIQIWKFTILNTYI